MTTQEFVLATRGSDLARRQTQMVAGGLQAAWPDLVVREEVTQTKGDRQADADLTTMGGSGVFTKELQRAVLEGRAHAAVHSLKDLPVEPTVGLRLGAILARGNPHDVLVSAVAGGVEALAPGTKIGTGSPRRAAMMRALRGDVAVVPVRGNVPTRVALAAGGQVGAVILAAAGLERLGWPSAGTFAHAGAILHATVLPGFLPAPGQGAIAVEVREDDPAAQERVAVLHDPATAAEVQAERAVLRALGGGCHLAMGGRGRLERGILRLTAVLFDDSSGLSKMAQAEGPPEQAEELGRALAAELCR